MNALENISSKIKQTKIFGIPIGDSILLLIGLGVSDSLIPAVSRIIPIPQLSGILSGAAIGAVSKVPAVERLLGPTMANVISATAVAVGVDYQIGLKAEVQSLVSSVLPVKTSGVITGGVSSAAPVSLGQADVSEQERRILETLKAS